MDDQLQVKWNNTQKVDEREKRGSKGPELVEGLRVGKAAQTEFEGEETDHDGFEDEPELVFLRVELRQGLNHHAQCPENDCHCYEH